MTDTPTTTPDTTAMEPEEVAAHALSPLRGYRLGYAEAQRRVIAALQAERTKAKADREQSVREAYWRAELLYCEAQDAFGAHVLKGGTYGMPQTWMWEYFCPRIRALGRGEDVSYPPGIAPGDPPDCYCALQSPETKEGKGS